MVRGGGVIGQLGMVSAFHVAYLVVKMETTIVCRGDTGIMENKMATAV